MEVKENFSLTTPKGFTAGVVACGLKKSGQLDLALLLSQIPCSAAGVFTTNKFKAAPVILSQRNLKSRRAQAVIVNSGNANAGTGKQGLKDAQEIAKLVGEKLNIPPNYVVVASTGPIGFPLPLEKIREGIKNMELSLSGGSDFARAIMTTDTKPKQGAVFCSSYTIAGVAKGAGMIHPNLATMLSFIATDASINPGLLRRLLKQAVDLSFNMITVDGQTSPNDMVVILANGLSGKEIKEGEVSEKEFKEALTELCLFLAKSIVQDGEGASKLIGVLVKGAKSDLEAKRAARAIAGSILVKTAIYGSEPNWGRVLVALGQSGVKADFSKIDLYMNDACLMKAGQPFPDVKPVLSFKVKILVDLNLGGGSATAWGCDLTPQYVTINSAYLT